MKKSIEEQMKIIMKGVDTLVNEEDLKKKLERCEKDNTNLIIKLGLDPSAPDIHIGHAVVLRKIKQLQDLGHKAVIIIGDFTGKIGDPTGKTKGRKALSEEQVRKNAETYKEQIFKILDKDKTEVRFNSEWLSELKFDEVLKLASVTTVARMMERDDFKKRFNNNVPIGIHEFFYPLMQGFDSLMVNADIELGGTDQTFNVLMGRTLQKVKGQEEQVALFMPILEGLDGIQKMSKSLGNYIGVNEDAEVMFKKVMEIPDNLIIKYFNLATDEHPDKIEEIRSQLDAGKNPRDVKFELAKIITSLYHTKEETEKAIEFYKEAFVNKSIPDNIPKLKLEVNIKNLNELVHILVINKFIVSAKEFRRLVEQGGVRINNEKVDSLKESIKSGDVIKLGKKKFIKLL